MTVFWTCFPSVAFHLSDLDSVLGYVLFECGGLDSKAKPLHSRLVAVPQLRQVCLAPLLWKGETLPCAALRMGRWDTALRNAHPN